MTANSIAINQTRGSSGQHEGSVFASNSRGVHTLQNSLMVPPKLQGSQDRSERGGDPQVNLTNPSILNTMRTADININKSARSIGGSSVIYTMPSKEG